MSGPYCKDCKFFRKMPCGETGECGDPGKIIYVGKAGRVNSAPDVHPYWTCGEWQQIEGLIETAGYDAALKELRNLLTDCIKNREEADPELKDEKWKGYIQGVEMAIYRLEMNNVS